MKIVCVVIAIVLVFGLAVSVSAIGANVICNGNACGGNGVRNYIYDVTTTEGALHQLHVGTDDPNILNYSNWLMPQGWNVAIFSIPEDHRDSFDPHGSIVGPNGGCEWSVVWTENVQGPGVLNGIFGYDHAGSPHDVGWFINSGEVTENWGAALGMGAGPVHAPTIPEPSSLLALLGGIGALGALVRRRS